MPLPNEPIRSLRLHASAGSGRAGILGALLCCVCVSFAPAAHAQSKTFAKQRKYVTTHEIPAADEIPLAPEAMPQPEAPSAPAEASATPSAPETAAPSAAPPPAPAGSFAVPASPGPSPAAPPANPPAPPPSPAQLPPPAWGAAPPAWGSAPPPAYAPQQATPVVAPDEAQRRIWLSAQLSQVDDQLALLRQERKSIAGPIVQLAFGYNIALACAAGAAVSFAGANDVYYEDDHGIVVVGDDDSRVSPKEADDLRKTGYLLTGLAAAGLALGISGTVRLVRNAAANRKLKAERKSLLTQRQSLRQQLDYGASILPGQVQLGVQGHF